MTSCPPSASLAAPYRLLDPRLCQATPPLAPRKVRTVKKPRSRPPLGPCLRLPSAPASRPFPHSRPTLFWTLIGTVYRDCGAYALVVTWISDSPFEAHGLRRKEMPALPTRSPHALSAGSGRGLASRPDFLASSPSAALTTAIQSA